MYTPPRGTGSFRDPDACRGRQRHVFLLEAFCLGNTPLAGDVAGYGRGARPSGLAVGLYPRLHDLVDRYYSLCYSGRAVVARK